ncbi:jg21325, partial [Pararge aegeria aegeria]
MFGVPREASLTVRGEFGDGKNGTRKSLQLEAGEIDNKRRKGEFRRVRAYVRRAIIVDITIPHDDNLVKAEKEKVSKYLDLAHEITAMWNVRLGYGEDESLKWISSGWLISDRFVVTSAHCTIKAWKGPVRKIMIAIESDMSQKSSRIYNVWKSHVHPKYQSPFKLHDIALLETEKPMLLDRSAVPACLPTGGIDDHEVEIAGWGITSARSRVMSNDLQK